MACTVSINLTSQNSTKNYIMANTTSACRDVCPALLASSAEKRNVKFQQCYLILFKRLLLYWFKFLLYVTRQRKNQQRSFIHLQFLKHLLTMTKATANTRVTIVPFPQDSSDQRGSYFSLGWIRRKIHVRGVNHKGLKQMTFQLFPLN